MTVIDDTAVLRTEDRFLRPSDVFEAGVVSLLCYTKTTQKFRYIPCKAEMVNEGYARIRFSHGPTLNLGYNETMVGKINTGYEGALPKTTYDHVYDIKKNFKYWKQYLNDYKEIGNKDCFLELSEFTDRKSGLFNIADENIFKFLGMYAKNGSYIRGKHLTTYTNLQYIDFWPDILQSLPLEIIQASNSNKGVRYYFKPNWFTDLIAGIACDKAPHHMIDEVVLGCDSKMAAAFREGLIHCSPSDPSLMAKDKPRWNIIGADEDFMGDISILWDKQGIDIIPTGYGGVGYRLCENSPRWSNYVQDAKHIDVPKEMYNIIPVESYEGALWVHGVRFICKSLDKQK